MGERLRVTLIANAGLLLEYQGITLMLDVPMPYNISLEKYVIPDANRIAEAVRS